MPGGGGGQEGSSQFDVMEMEPSKCTGHEELMCCAPGKCPEGEPLGDARGLGMSESTTGWTP